MYGGRRYSRLKDIRFYSVLPAFCLVLFFLIALLPVFLMAGKSFIYDGILSGKHYVSVVELRVVALFFRSLVLSLSSTLLSLLIGVPFAFFLSRFSFPGKKTVSLLYLAPLFIPPHVHALSWIYLFGDQGVINSLLTSLGVSSAPLCSIHNQIGVILILTCSYFPLIIFLTLIGLSQFDRKLDEAAEFVRNKWLVLYQITLPLVAPFILAGALIVFVFSFFNYSVPALLRVPTYPVEIFSRFSAFYDEAGAAALSMPPICLIMVLFFGLRLWFREKHFTTYFSGCRASEPVLIAGSLKLIITTAMTVILFAGVFLPISSLLIQAGSLTSFVIAAQGAKQEVQTTILVASLGASCITVFALCFGKLLEKASGYRQAIIEYFTFLPFAFPATTVGIGLVYLWNSRMTGALYTSVFIVILAMCARFLPLAIHIMRASIRRVNPNLYEVASFNRTSRLKKWFFIEVPLIRDGLIACWIVSFVFCTGELGATLLVIPPGSGTVSLKIYTLMHYGAGPLVAALALLLLGINFTVFIGLTKKTANIIT